jgi:hypothetical protein
MLKSQSTILTQTVTDICYTCSYFFENIDADHTLEVVNIESCSHMLGNDSVSMVLKMPARMLQSKLISLQVLADSKLHHLSHKYYVVDVPVASLLKCLPTAIWSREK